MLRFRQSLAGFGTVALLTIGQPVLAEPLQPQGAWVIDFDDTQCTALRKFGPANDPIDFMIRPAFNGQSFELFVGRKGGGKKNAWTRRGTIDLGSGELESWFISAGPKSGMTVSRVRVADSVLRAVPKTSNIMVKAGAQEYHLAIGDRTNVLKTLDTCVADLRDYWGNVLQEEPGTSPPIGNITGIFEADDYPAEALVEKVEGAVQYTLLIDENGAVVGCDPIMATRAPILELMGCQVIMRRAKYTPARDRAGRPVRQALTTPPIRWTLED